MRCDVSRVLVCAAFLVACRDKAPAPTMTTPLVASTGSAVASAPPVDVAHPIEAPPSEDELARQESERHHVEWKRELAAAIAALPPTFQALFTLNHKDFPEEVVFQHPLEVRHSGDSIKGDMRCYVHPDVIPGGIRGGLTCAPYGMGGEIMMFTFDSILIATRDGLWIETDENLDDASKLDPKRMILTAVPAPKRTVQIDEARKRTTYTVAAQGDAWCITRNGQAYLCVRAGEGIVGGGGRGQGMGDRARTETWGTGPKGSW